MNKTSADHHWTLGTSVTGDGQRVFYVKIFGRLPADSIKITITISDRSGNTTFLTTTVDACCATASHDDILESWNVLSVHDKQLAKWNGGNELGEHDHLKNIWLTVTLGV
jgi:hypothetical protein